MDIVGIGTDIVECLRIARMIEQHGELFLTRVYTDWEMRHCHSRKHATEHFAALWAAKEAIFKSTGTGWRRGMAWTDLEVRDQPGAPPEVILSGAARDQAARLGIGRIMLTLAHCRAYATATALAIRTGPPLPG